MDGLYSAEAMYREASGVVQLCKQILVPCNFAATIPGAKNFNKLGNTAIYFLGDAPEFQFGIRDFKNGNSEAQYHLCSNEQTAVLDTVSIVGILEMDFRPLSRVTGGQVSGRRRRGVNHA